MSIDNLQVEMLTKHRPACSRRAMSIDNLQVEMLTKHRPACSRRAMRHRQPSSRNVNEA